MKKIYDDSAISMIPCERGFIFAAIKKETDDVKISQKEGQSVIAFREHSFDTGQNSLVTKNVYLMNKFGQNFEFFANNLPDYINCKAIKLHNGNTLIVNYDGEAQIFNKSTELKWSGSLKHKGFSPADVVADKDYVWCSYPESNAAIKYNINSMQQTFKIGGSASGGLNEPFGLWIAENELIITSSATAQLLSINLDTFQAKEMVGVYEPSLQYIKVDSNEVVLTRTGIYKI